MTSNEQAYVYKNTVSDETWRQLRAFLKLPDDNRQLIQVMVGSSAHKLLKRLDKNFYADHEKRVIAERDELEDRITKLSRFIDGNSAFASMKSDDQRLLLSQRNIMKSYRDILNARINRF